LGKKSQTLGERTRTSYCPGRGEQSKKKQQDKPKGKEGAVGWGKNRPRTGWGNEQNRGGGLVLLGGGITATGKATEGGVVTGGGRTTMDTPGRMHSTSSRECSGANLGSPLLLSGLGGGTSRQQSAKKKKKASCSRRGQWGGPFQPEKNEGRTAVRSKRVPRDIVKGKKKKKGEGVPKKRNQGPRTLRPIQKQVNQKKVRILTGGSRKRQKSTSFTGNGRRARHAKRPTTTRTKQVDLGNLLWTRGRTLVKRGERAKKRTIFTKRKGPPTGWLRHLAHDGNSGAKKRTAPQNGERRGTQFSEKGGRTGTEHQRIPENIWLWGKSRRSGCRTRALPGKSHLKRHLNARRAVGKNAS